MDRHGIKFWLTSDQAIAKDRRGRRFTVRFTHTISERLPTVFWWRVGLSGSG
jgi:hypothetical protein